MCNCIVIRKKALINIICVLLIAFSFVSFLSVDSAYAAGMVVFNQGSYESWKTSSSNLKKEGCGAFTSAHAIQWLLDISFTKSQAEDLLRALLKESGSPQSATRGSYLTYMEKQFGITKTLDVTRNKSKTISVFDNGGCIIVNPVGHYVLANGYTYHDINGDGTDDLLIRIVDSSWGSTLGYDYGSSSANRAHPGYDLTTFKKIVKKDIDGKYNNGKIYWVTWETFSGKKSSTGNYFREEGSYHTYALSKPKQDKWTKASSFHYNEKLGSWTETPATAQQFVYVKNEEAEIMPYDAADTISPSIKHLTGDKVIVVAKAYNRSGNLWYKLNDGRYVYSGDVALDGTTTPIESNEKKLEFQNVACPVNYKIGSSGGYKLSGGTLVSNEELKTITSTIKKSDGAVISGPKTRNISGKIYSIVSLDTFESEDNGVKFSKITQSGNYVWILTATDASGKALTLEMPFTASSSATSSKNVSLKYTNVVGVEINEQNFPDANFRSYISALDKDNNGKLSDEEIAIVKTLYVNDRGIHSLKGIEYFTELTLLHCYSNNISSLNLASLTKLIELDCGDNPISNLDVSMNTALTTLICGDTYLKTIDLSKNTSLTRLVCEQYCYGWNELISIDVSNCPVLNSLVKEQTYGDSIIKGHPYLYNHWLHGWATKNSDETLATYLFVGPDVEVITDAGIYVSDKKKPDSREEKLRAYVTRCYEIILGRQPDAGGMDTWVNELNSGRKAASEIIDNFVRSQEFLGKHYSNADAVEILYKAMLGRGSDPAGKADWVGKLDAGYPFAVVINGFCGSKEFKEICDSYGIAPGSVSMGQESVSDQQIRAFVTRCYKIILGRDADEVGMNTWFNELKSRRRTAAEIIEQFVYSQEFQNKKYSNPDAVEILYKAMLGRGSDPAGKADWVGRLAGGQPLTAIINGFCGSMEFTAICEAYGITPGSVKVETVSKAAEEVPEATVQKPERKANLIEITNASDTVNENLGTAVQAIYINEEKAKEFIGRCYQAILGREAGAEELNGWIGQMMNGSKTADQIARGFLFSGEFKGRNIGNEELVKILYRVYMNREADPEGLATWTQKLDEGTSLNDLLNVFAKTSEFRAVVRNMAE